MRKSFAMFIPAVAAITFAACTDTATGPGGMSARPPIDTLYARAPIDTFYARPPIDTLYARPPIDTLYARPPIDTLY